jgi:prepilin-type N-terminal cleavage/methylation domain-containing protein
MTRSDTDTREAGFTIVEVLVAVVLLAVGALTTFGLLSAATRNTERAKATQVALDLAQQEVEAMHSLGNEELAMKTTPPHSSDPLNPDFRVKASAGTFALSREPVSSYQTLVHNGGVIEGVGTSEEGKFIENGVVNPGPEDFENGDVTGEVYRYVVWRNDDVCGAACPTQQDYKQIIVAVKLDTPGNQAGERGYVEVQSNFVDPTDNPKKDPAPGPEGKVVTAQQFFLTDTPCAAGGSTERGDITGDHLLHNTLGTCASGPQTGPTAGAPDAMLLGGPPDPAPEDPTNPSLYDYANDTFLDLNPETDRGLQILLEEETGCTYKPKVTWTHPEAQVHRWVTDPMEADFTMTEKVTLEFYTRTLNDELYNGTVCVYLYDRHETGSPPVATDTPLTNKVGGTGYWTYTPEKNDYWPRFEWKKIRLTMTFNKAPYTIPADDRLGVALSVERANTSPADAIPIMYDHPTYPTRIEVDTSTPIEGG